MGRDDILKSKKSLGIPVFAWPNFVYLQCFLRNEFSEIRIMTANRYKMIHIKSQVRFCYKNEGMCWCAESWFDKQSQYIKSKGFSASFSLRSVQHAVIWLDHGTVGDCCFGWFNAAKRSQWFHHTQIDSQQVTSHLDPLLIPRSVALKKSPLVIYHSRVIASGFQYLKLIAVCCMHLVPSYITHIYVYV